MSTIPAGTVHNTVPSDIAKALSQHPSSAETWKDITPLARNEWICWMTAGAKEETRKKRIRVGMEQLRDGKRRPCCWPGCPHREKNGA